jgi:energy-coupling factor transporter ATP-binding protein EcfA2
MINLERTPAPPAWGELTRPAVARLQQTADAGGYKTQRRFEFDEVWHKFRDELGAKSFGKCVYCETRFTDSPDVDHFRPRTHAEGLGKGDVAPDHYWWLAYDWDNIAMSCRRCNRAKRNRFPVHGQRISPGQPVSNERPMLIDPFGDRDPLLHLWFERDGSVQRRTDDGEITIQVLDLDRRELRALRAKHAERIVDLYDAGRLDDAEIERLTAPEAEFAGLARQLLARLLREAEAMAAPAEQAPPDLAEPSDLAPPDLTPPGLAAPPERPRSMAEQLVQVPFTAPETSGTTAPTSVWIDRVGLDDFGCIPDLELEFSSPATGREPWIVLLGQNGVGKSTILKAVALALAADDDRQRLLPDPTRLIRHGRPNARVSVGFSDGSESTLTLQRRSGSWTTTGDRPSFGLVAYGSTRLLRRNPTRALQSATGPTLTNLFDPFMPLADVEPWLAGTDTVASDDFKVIATQLKLLLEVAADVELARRNGRLSTRLFGERLDLDQLSDGYQSILALALDLCLAFGHEMEQGFSTENYEGMVLIDELEVHLHPEWKMRVVADLRAMFPHLQFVATTHDPLCLRGLEPGEIHLLRRDDDGAIEVEQIDVPSGLDADEILTGQWFGLDTTLDPAVEADLVEYRRLRMAGYAPGDPELAPLQRRLDRALGSYTRTSLGRAMVDAAAEYVSGSVPEAPEPLDDQQVKARLLALLEEPS